MANDLDWVEYTNPDCDHRWEWRGHYWTRYRECPECGERHDLWRD